MDEIEKVAQALAERAAECGHHLLGVKYSLQLATAAITAYRAALEEQGMVVVPKEPTEEMLLAGHHEIDWCRDMQDTYTNENPTQTPVIGGEICGTTCKQDMQDAWSAMIAAAPKG